MPFLLKVNGREGGRLNRLRQERENDISKTIVYNNENLWMKEELRFEDSDYRAGERGKDHDL